MELTNYKLIKFVPEENLLYFSVCDFVYKAKIVKSQDSKKYLVYIFNFKKSFEIDLKDLNNFEKEFTAFDELKSIESNKDNGSFVPSELLKNQSFETDLDTVSCPLSGRVIKILVQENQFVEINQPLVVIESMKMENEIRSPKASFIKNISIRVSDLVEQNQVLIILEDKK